MRDVTERGAWEEWLQYFCNGVARQAEDALSRTKRINSLHEKWRAEAASDSSSTPSKLIDLIGSNPYVTPRGVQEKLGVAYNTAAAGIRQLERRGIVTKMGDNKRDRVFCALEILSILKEPPRLDPD